MKLKQNRFFSHGIETNDNSTWKIPIFVTSESSYPNPSATVLFETREIEINLGKLPTNEWVLLNSDYIGFYKTLYSSENLQSLKKSLDKLNSKDRIMVMTDLFAFVRLQKIRKEKFLVLFI